MAIASIICKGCDLQVIGATIVKSFETHRGLCKSCRGFPVGLEATKRKHEVCPDCGKETWEH